MSRIGQDCLQEQVGFVTSVFRSGPDWSSVYKESDGLTRLAKSVWLGGWGGVLIKTVCRRLGKSACRNGWDSQECLAEWGYCS